MLCDRTARFIVRHSAPGTFRFAARTSAEARAALAPYPDAAHADAVVVIDARGAAVRSDAALAIAGRLDSPWRALAALRLVPRPARDAVYDLVARNRYRWFGRRS